MKYCALFLLALILNTVAEASPYLVGVGKSDITGPPADVLMMGYVKLQQKTAGIQTRLWARAFLIADPGSQKRVAIVTTDLLQVPQAVKRKVVEELGKKFGGAYSDDNVLISASHTHSGPGGYSHYHLYELINLGFSQQNFDGIVAGIVAAISDAHAALRPGRIRLNRGQLLGFSRNRSIEAYRLNPSEERARYPEETDKEMTLLRLESENGEPIGSVNWFAVHATSVKSSNHLISADNKGLAQRLFEKAMPAGFVAGFGNSNAGDVTPNTSGDIDGDDHWDCPLVDGFLCAEASAKAQYQTARQLYDSASTELTGPIDYRHRYVDMSKVAIEPEFSGGEKDAHTCPAAVGISMLAGTKDGRGVGKEGVNCSSGGAAVKAACLRDRCHGEKPVALALGYHRTPWTPEVLPLQIVRLGQIALVAVPGEFTTMSGRRLRETVLPYLQKIGVSQVVLAGYANAYAGYVATREEYQSQQYEGASTHFGEWTLNAYLQEFARIARAMADFTSVDPGPTPRDLSSSIVSKQPAVSQFDREPIGYKLGDVVEDAKKSYPPGCPVSATFIAGNPNRDIRRGDTYLEVQAKTDGGWQVIATDDDWNTRFEWQANSLNASRATISWMPEATAKLPGLYRLVLKGTAELRSRGKVEYRGESQTFEIVRQTGPCP